MLNFIQYAVCIHLFLNKYEIFNFSAKFYCVSICKIALYFLLKYYLKYVAIFLTFESRQYNHYLHLYQIQTSLTH